MAISVFIFKDISHIKLKGKGILRDFLYKMKAISIFWQKKIIMGMLYKLNPEKFIFDHKTLYCDGRMDGRTEEKKHSWLRKVDVCFHF